MNLTALSNMVASFFHIFVIVLLVEYEKSWQPCLTERHLHKLCLQDEVSRQVVLKCPLFVNVHTIENVNAGQQVIKKYQSLVNVVCERLLRVDLVDERKIQNVQMKSTIENHKIHSTRKSNSSPNESMICCKTKPPSFLLLKLDANLRNSIYSLTLLQNYFPAISSFFLIGKLYLIYDAFGSC